MKKIAKYSIIIYLLASVLSWFFPENKIDYSVESSTDGLVIKGEVIFLVGKVNVFDKSLSLIERKHKIKAPKAEYFDSSQVLKNKWYADNYIIKVNWLCLPLGFLVAFLILYIFSKLLTFGKEETVSTK